MFKTSDVQDHIVANVIEGQPSFSAAQWDEPVPHPGGPLPFPAIRFQPLFLPESHNKNRCCTVQIDGMCYAGPGPFTRRVQSVAAPFCHPRPYWRTSHIGATAPFSPPYRTRREKESPSLVQFKSCDVVKEWHDRA